LVRCFLFSLRIGGHLMNLVAREYSTAIHYWCTNKEAFGTETE